jgi:ribonucleoside-diphosphate reductase alpha chain
VPPVGSGSILCGTTSGIEPIFALYYERRSESLSAQDFLVFHPLVVKYLKLQGKTDEEITKMSPKQIKSHLNESFVTAHDIDSAFRVRMQATIQKYIDSSISSTINLPEDISVKAVGDIYFQAWKAGLKGVTVYREGSREGILKTVKEKDDTVPIPMPLTSDTVPLVNGGKEICPSCGHHDLKHENGCLTCPSCGWSACDVKK